MMNSLRKLNSTEFNYQEDFLIPSHILQLVFH
jgi:hypothetical protein